MSKKSIVKVISLVLSILILLTVLPVGAFAADAPSVTPETVVEDVTLSKQTENAVAGSRVRAEEGDSLHTIVVDNGDGTHTMTLYDHPVKFVNSKGEVEDISLEIASSADGSYKTKANDIQTVFPQKISDGISLSGKGVNVKLSPCINNDLKDSSHTFGMTESETNSYVRHSEEQSDEESYKTPSIGEIVADATVTKIDNETVSYYYDNKTTLEYSLTYTGFKEDIVVSEYTGQTEYAFLLETGGLTLTKIDESYYLTNENGEIKATLGDIIIFTADERNNARGTMTHETVKENELYIITIHVDAEYLKDENTKYPIRIDPTIEISYDNNGSAAIQDVTINSNAGSSGSSGSLYVGYRSNYGISRTLMKFPGLNLSAIPSASSITSAYLEIRDLMCETANMTLYGYLFDGNDWSESTATWSNVSPNSWTEMPNAYADINYSNGASKNPTHRYSLNITQAVKNWKTGFYSQSKGIMLRANDNVEYDIDPIYKTFASFNRSSHKPSLKVNYQAPEIFLSYETNKGANMAVAQKRQVVVQCDYTPQSISWESSDRNIATVSNSGLVTGKAPGTVNITATYTFSGEITCEKTISFVVKNCLGIADNEDYYIMNYASKKNLSLASGSGANGTNVCVRDRSTEHISQWQLLVNDNKEYRIGSVNSSSRAVLNKNGTDAVLWTESVSMPQYFTILRVDDEPYDGLYLICIGNYYLTQDSSGTNAYFTTTATNYSYWSLMQCSKGNAYLTSTKYLNDLENFDTSANNTLFKDTLSDFGYTSNAVINPLPETAYLSMQNSQIFVSRGHGTEGAILFFDEQGNTTGSIVSTIAFPGDAPSPYYAVATLNVNQLAGLRCVLFLGCSTGVDVQGYLTTFNLVDETYKKGAHFVLGTTETVHVGDSDAFLKGFIEAVDDSSNIENCVQSAISRVEQDGYLHYYPIYKVGDEKQFLQ